MRRRWLWMLVLGWCMALPCAWAQSIELQDALFLHSDATSPPDGPAGWTPQGLPDRWRDSRPNTDGSAWYRMQFERDALNRELQAAFIPHASVNAEVYLNGVLLGTGGSFEEPLSRTWNRPRMYLIAPEVLHAGRNVLDVHLKAHLYTQASLYPPRIGSEKDIRDLYEQAYFLRITLNQIVSILIAVVGLLMLNMWWRRRQDTAYGYFAASALVWAVQSTNLYVLDPPLDTAHWEILVNASFQIFSALLLISMLRYVRAEWKPLNLLLWSSLLASPLAMVLAPPESFLRVTAALHMCTLIGSVGSLVLLFRSAWRDRNKDARLLLATMGLIVLFAAHDWLLHSQHLWFSGALKWLPGELYLLQYSAPVVFLAIGWIMTVRFIQVLNEFEALSVELDQRVQAKHAQLEQSFERLRALERERAVQDERERIHSDLHDDVGAKLLSLVYRAGSPEAADLARSALQDLRDVVSRVGSGSFQLEDVLADIRAECEQRLSGASIALEWHQTEGIAPIELTQPHALNLGRIVRETISNAIRHAQASAVTVHITPDGEGLHIEICDNGIGSAVDGHVPGRGLRNMQARAQLIGAQLERFSVLPQGCGVRLTIPSFTGT